MDITGQIAKLYSTSPFDLMERDAEHVIMVINYVLEKYSEESEKIDANIAPVKKQKDNFWDF